MGQQAGAIFLDRDGVLNRAVVRGGKPYPPNSVEELVIDVGVPEALGRLTTAGFQLIGVTNQPDVARGTQTRQRVEEINRTLLDRLPLKEIRVCYHDDKDHCGCRKPEPGLLSDAAVEFGIELSASFMIGDRWKDIEAGRRSGCTTIWLRTNYSEEWQGEPPEYTATDLNDAADFILATSAGTIDHARLISNRRKR
jgi:D-glycero-D-manno-heptose 1,7-bisphosphate phosphatase